MEKFSRGEMLVHPYNLPIIFRNFEAMLVWMDEKKMDPEHILLFLQVALKERITVVGSRIAEMASTFVTPDDL